MYKSPLTVLESFVDNIMEQKNDKIVAIVRSKIDVDVDKTELIRALQYDRNQYDAGYKDGKRDAMRWIPVSERLPEDHTERVIVKIKDANNIIGHPDMDTDRYLKDMWVRWGHNVTHWMPLPEPPEVTE